MNQPSSAPVEIRVRRPDAVTAANVQGRFPTFFHPEGDDLVFRSWLDQHVPVSDHLKWLHGMIEHDRKFFRRLEAAGASVAICIRCSARELHLEPEALLLAHQFHLPTEICLSK